MAKTIPDGYHTVTAYLHVKGAADALAYYAKAFGAKERYRLMMGPTVAHAEFTIGDSIIMLAEENEAWGNKSPKTLGGHTGGLCVYVEDCDATFAQAVAAGGTVLMPVGDQFYGDRSGAILDPFGHKWNIATHKEDVPPTEMQARMEAWMQAKAQAQ
ncbi:VOC family protein [Limnoglobus roseus]|uniref:VOC family protein n=1 Tax=Limnoglobus roseus TaxID=2598579 RepID=A0A5C1ADY6_9BACT|nr:VOC family protein [Limnoglobus roseus]QEL15334.1 VOC family protein [Limnoglobus roseus]